MYEGTMKQKQVSPRPSPRGLPDDGPYFGMIDEALGGRAHRLSKGAAPSWEQTLESAAKCIISIRASHVLGFDTESAGAYSATGFIVDAQRGLVLTNRHVVSPAPIVAYGILENYEEVELIPVYRDPIHDFGFFQFDPAKVKFMHLSAITLSPERARVGLDIRVIGNNAGEKLSILAGTLARLDRRAPDYGVGEYNDFNTFYLQAASGTSGGSSGSPVLDIQGQAVALNAGGSSRASSSYYLPLDRVQRTLRLLQEGRSVPRGTLQTKFTHVAYDQIRRLGLPLEYEGKVREIYPHGTGLLVVSHVLPAGPAHGILQPGDILYSVNGTIINTFLLLFAILDDAVGACVDVTICRGKQLFELNICIQDLHGITPSRFVEIGGGVLNELSYQLAMSYVRPVGGVFLASSGHMFESAGILNRSVITSINHLPTPNLDEFIRVCMSLSDRARVPVQYYSIDQPFKEKMKIMDVDRHWNVFRIGTRNDHAGTWDLRNLSLPPAPAKHEPTRVFLPTGDDAALRIRRSLVAIDFHVPYLVDGLKSHLFYGVGLVVDAEEGLVVCDRDTVPVYVGDLTITIGSSLTLPGEVVFLHPTLNLVFVRYDASLAQGNIVSADLRFEAPALKAGDDVQFVGVSADHSILVKRSTISGVYAINTRPSLPPRWRATNIEGIKLDASISSQGGVLCDNDCGVRALWVNYSFQDDKGSETSVMQGLHIHLIRPSLEALQKHSTPEINSLQVEFWPIRVSFARALGLTDERLAQFEALPNFSHSLLHITGLLSTDCPSAELLKTGDVVLQCNNRPILTLSDVADFPLGKTAMLTILRNGAELELQVPTSKLLPTEATEIICWGGAILQTPNRSVLEQVTHTPPKGVYIACTLSGSPVNTFNISPGVWITHVDEIPTPNLETFLHTAKSRSKSDYVRISTTNRNGTMAVSAIKLDPIYWPLWQLVSSQSHWTRIEH
ncbi:hypothetical protein DSO57_1034599 [Entomophthora muscae]|uniref:Uncharacterized protein n=1 Tax=Entomophthora muscae TaxID=34485 RepID=A0ACC2S1P9_9FUNG|nr:hypothetical protein DSO57_1034599 [Entomophthora muscae]